LSYRDDTVPPTPQKFAALLPCCVVHDSMFLRSLSQFAAKLLKFVPTNTQSEPSANAGKEAESKPNPFAAPSLSLPKGGGAIKRIGEKIGVNSVNGTGSLSVPVFTT
jgi:hypothetical protein